jgi:SSS family solute:Na+ symporter
MNLAIVALFFIGMILIGALSFRRIRGTEDFFVADRRGTPLLITGSLVATIVGGSSTIGMAGLGFEKGLVGAWWLLVGVVGLVILSCSLAKRVRRYALYTLPELLGEQYGSGVKLVASVIISIAWLGIIAGQMVAAGKILDVLIPGHFDLMILLSGGVFITYTLLGGQYSILRTDTVQAAILLLGILICVPLSIGKAGGLESLRSTLGVSYFSFPTNTYGDWTYVTTLLFMVGSSYVVGPDIYSRLFCARNEGVARNSVAVTALILIPLAFSITLIGMSARVIAPGISPEGAFPAVVRDVLPMGASALVIAGLLSAVMSSGDTCLLTTSTIISADIIKPFLKRGIRDESLLFISRAFIVLIGLLSLGIALKLKGVIRSLLLGYTIYSSGLVLPVIFGFYGKRLRLHPWGAMAAIIGGGGVAMFGKWMGYPHFGLWGMGISGVLLFVISWVGRLLVRGGNRC